MTIAVIRQQYRIAQSLKRKMDVINDPMTEAAKDEWYRLERVLQGVLSEILRGPFVLLSKPQLLGFLSLCSSYRPCEPHGILIRLSMAVEEYYP